MNNRRMFRRSIICGAIFLSIILFANVGGEESSRRAASQSRKSSSTTANRSSSQQRTTTSKNTSSVSRPTNSNKITVNNRSAKTNSVTTTNKSSTANRSTSNNPQWVEQNQYGSVRQSNYHQNAQTHQADGNRPALEKITASCNGTTQIWGRGNFKMRFTGNLSVDSRTRVSLQNEGRNFAKARRGDFWEYRNVDTNVTINGAGIDLTAQGNMRSLEGEGSGTLTMTGSGSFRTSSQSGRVPASGVTIDFGRNRGVY